MPQITINDLSGKIIGAAIEVHKELGPGLLESAYEVCLQHELTLKGLKVERQKPMAVEYKGLVIECGYRLDLVVEDLSSLNSKPSKSFYPSIKPSCCPMPDLESTHWASSSTFTNLS